MGRKLLKWFRRTHDVLAIVLCCLWIAGWFVNVRIDMPPATAIWFDAGSIEGVFATTTINEDLVDADYAIQLRPLDRHDKMRLVEKNSFLSWLRARPPIFCQVEPTNLDAGYLNYMQAEFGCPSILIVLPFLIWPLGRLTHRIVRRKDKIPNPV